MMRSRILPVRNAGLTLVELMVALTIGLIIVGAIMALYLSSQHVYRAQDNLSRLQEDSRYGVNTMERTLRMTGFEGCMTGHTPLHNQLNTGNPPPAPYNFAQPLQGYSYVAGAWTPSAPPSSVLNALATPAYPPDNYPPGGSYVVDTASDIVTVQFADPSQAINVTQPSGNAATLLIGAGLQNPFYSGQILLVTNCASADIFQVTGNPQGNAVTHNSGQGNPGNTSQALSQNYGSDAEVMPMSTLTYVVASYQPPTPAGQPTPPPSLPYLLAINTTNAGPTGTVSPVVVIRGVRQMKIFYGVDTDQDHAANEYLTTPQIVAGGVNLASVVSLRVVLLLETSEDNLARQHQVIPNYPYPGAPGAGTYTATDLRLYRPFSFTVALRNRIS